MYEERTTQKRVKLCYLVSSPKTAVSFLNGHIDYLAMNFDTTVVCNFDGAECDVSPKSNHVNIAINRRISPLSDARAMWRLYRLFRRERFDIVHSVTPKAGLLTAVSSRLAMTPIRIHWYTGQVWVLSSGFHRLLLKNLDKLVGFLNTCLLVDSPSQRDFLVQQGVIKESKSHVLGAGSISGVDTSIFKPNPELRIAIQKELDLREPTAQVIIFVGRLNHDKGIDVLLEVFSEGRLAGDPYLIVVGSDEGDYQLKFKKLPEMRRNKLRYVPHTNDPEIYLAASDIFCLPSLREGFGLSVIEASAVELPVVASRIYGITDSVKDQVTGILISPGNAVELELALNKILMNPMEGKRMGQVGRTRVLELWQAATLQIELERFYMKNLKNIEITGKPN
jgi:glycosyltransferase involved in cell wall biosynthesis